MGAALTYARRYALFTLVGIAGEDDLDAPDLHDQGPPRSPRPGPINGAGGFPVSDGAAPGRPETSNAGRSARGEDGPPQRRPRSAVTLAPDQSAKLRDRLLAEIADISSSEQATAWARAALPAKNSLTVTDAGLVEEAFERWLATTEVAAATVERPAILQPEPVTLEDLGTTAPTVSNAAPETPAARTAAVSNPPSGIDKSALAHPEPKRHRNKEHLRFVAQQPCLVCGRTPSDPHHLRFAQPRALGRKVSDEFVVPLCRSHHRALHRVGNEPGWWRAAGIDALQVAGKLWGQSRLIAPAEPGRSSPEPPPIAEAAPPAELPSSLPGPRRSKRGTKSSAADLGNGRMP
jgi:hypothetical protein